MNALQIAIQEGQYKLAAHIIVLATATAMRGNGYHGRKKAKKLLLVRPR